MKSVKPAIPLIPDLEARSPWSRHNDKAQVTVHVPAAPVEGTVRISGSKSATNRAFLIAALAQGRSQIEGVLKSDDSYWCLDCLTKLGVQLSIDGDTVVLDGCGGVWPVQEGELYVGAAGTVARFLPGALAAGTGTWSITGGKRMSERPMAPLLNSLSQLGARITQTATDGGLPFTLEASGLQGGEIVLPGSVSSQFASGLLLAAPYAKTPLTVHFDGETVQRAYVDMTLQMMESFGIAPEISDDGRSITVSPGTYQAQVIRLEPDLSTCCYFWAIAALTGGRIRVSGVNPYETSQPDVEFLNALERMSCTVLRGNGWVEVRGAQQLKGGFSLNMNAWSDQTLTLAAMAPFADGPITLTDAAHIRHHECDRIAAVCQELRKLGIRVEERPDGLTVYPGQPIPALLDSHDDHRMAMSLSLIGLKSGSIRILNPGCVSKTCPDYFERLAGLGIEVEFLSQP